ncbi:hypothetical protein, conserved [Babesia ovata]|uniref:Uncharacterized protein n=1 Tax=Babesia ovata TaxID=189622 RepID=A0A2H6KB72_9APIC|nr:uncharacterized protein BOVATA_017310 [Babesia ovata]GBE60238.1 hypothetical protein, conserved [Babesia ovata]
MVTGRYVDYVRLAGGGLRTSEGVLYLVDDCTKDLVMHFSADIKEQDNEADETENAGNSDATASAHAPTLAILSTKRTLMRHLYNSSLKK